MSSELIHVNITIPSGVSKSTAQDLGGRQLVGIITPGTLQGDTMVFESSPTGTTFSPVYTDADTPARVSVPVGTSRLISLGSKGDYFIPVRHLIIETQTTGSAQNQSAARTLTLVLRS